MYHYKLSPNEIWEMTEEQVEMLIHGLAWMGIIKIKSIVGDSSMGGWNRLKGLIKK